MNGSYAQFVLISGFVVGLLYQENEDDTQEVLLCVGLFGIKIVWW